MNGLAIRKATPEDALCVGVLGVQVFLDTYAKQGVSPLLAREVIGVVGVEAVAKEFADPAVRFLVAEREEYMVGFAKWTPGARHELLPAKTPAAELNRLYVQEAATGTGVGKALMRAVEAEAARAGAATLWLTAWVGNPRALSFYPRQGYTDSGSTLYTYEGVSHENRLFVKRL